jgi:hypothetical protein
MDPSRQTDGLADVGGAELAAGVGTIGVHDEVGPSAGNCVEKVVPRFDSLNSFVNRTGRR